MSEGWAKLLYVGEEGHGWEQVEANKSQKWTVWVIKPQNQTRTTQQSMRNSARTLWQGPDTQRVWFLSTLMAPAVVRRSINIIIFASLLQHKKDARETCSAGNDGFQKAIQRLRLCEDDNDGEWSTDKGLHSHLAFQKKDCSLAGLVSIQSDTMVIFQIVWLP